MKNLVTRILKKQAKAIHPVMVSALINEIELFKQHPKRSAWNIKTFDATAGETCFMGQGFQQFDNIQFNTGFNGKSNSQLATIYRNLVGTMCCSRNNYEGDGNVKYDNETLLEIWAAHHWHTDRKMVLGVVAYLMGKRKTLPQLKFRNIYLNIKL